MQGLNAALDRLRRYLLVVYSCSSSVPYRLSIKNGIATESFVVNPISVACVVCVSDMPYSYKSFKNMCTQ